MGFIKCILMHFQNHLSHICLYCISRLITWSWLHWICAQFWIQTNWLGLTSWTGLETWELFSRLKSLHMSLMRFFPHHLVMMLLRTNCWPTRNIMLAAMVPELQKQHEHMHANTIVFHLHELFDEQARSERFKVSRLLFTSKMEQGSSVVQFVLKMNGYI